jgi:hypothetical protein
MATSSSRPVVVGVVFAVVSAAAAWLIWAGVNVTHKQKRVDELAKSIESQQSSMKRLYDRRAEMITIWLAEREAKKPITDAKGEATAAAAAAGAFANGAAAPDPMVDPVKAQEELSAVRLALAESRQIGLASQDEFNRFDRLQNEVSNYVAAYLIEQMRSEATVGNGTTTLNQIREFERLEMEIANTRRDYHAAAFERNQLVIWLNDLPFGLTKPPPPAPVFAAEAILHGNAASR